MKPICFYHKADLDGVCSAAIVRHFVPDCELYGMDYGDEFPWDDVETEAKRIVYMVDFSLLPKDMTRLAEVYTLVWIDHHKSAIDGCGAVTPDRLLDVRCAACELTWAWFNVKVAGGGTGLDVPEVVRLLGRYDVFDTSNPDWEKEILPFQYGLRGCEGAYSPLNPMWDFATDPIIQEDEVMVTQFIARMICNGNHILRYQASVNRRACEAGGHEFVLFEDKPGVWSASRLLNAPQPWANGKRNHRVLACNTTTNNSQFFEGLYDPKKHDVMCAYCRIADGRWKVSLYTTKATINVGEIAKAFGGGGHVRAAGFVCTKLPWEGA